MKKLNPLYKFFFILSVSFILLSIVSSNTKLRKLHTQYYCALAQPIFNILNPHVFAEFEEGAPENENRWAVSFKIWDKRNYDSRIRVKSFRVKNPPRGILYQNPHELVLIPSLFLLCLFLATPLNWKGKILRFLLSMLVFYLFMTLYLSYRFEFTLNNQSLPFDSIWHVIISFFGLGGNTDPIFIVAFLIWIVMVGPLLFKVGYFKNFLNNIRQTQSQS
jgi:hypothetical protein